MPFDHFSPTDSTVLGEQTTLSAAASVAAAALTVQDTDGFTAADFLLVGHLGSEGSEILTLDSITGTITLTPTSTVAFAHPVSTPVYELLYDKVRFYGAETIDGVYTLIETQDVAVDAPQGNHFQYTSSTYEYFKAVYYNSTTLVEYPALATAPVFSSNRDYSTRARYKTYAGITDSSRDAEIDMLLRAYTRVVNGYLFGDTEVSLFTTVYTENMTVGNAQSSDVLLMSHGPIQSVTSIAADGTTVYTEASSSLSIDSFEGFRIFLDGALSHGGSGRRLPIQVVYTAGYDTVPEDVELALWRLMSLSLNREIRDSDGIASYTVLSKSVTFDRSVTSAAIPTPVKALLAPYRRARIARFI